MKSTIGSTVDTPISKQSDRDLSLQPVQACEIAIRDVSLSVRGTGIVKTSLPTVSRKRSYKSLDEEQNVKSDNKRILSGISADFPSGQLTAILGGSGSGKTSL